MMHAIVCKFGEYGTLPAVFDSKTQIRCTPLTYTSNATSCMRTLWTYMSLLTDKT
jgi:hypothetical protein